MLFENVEDGAVVGTRSIGLENQSEFVVVREEVHSRKKEEVAVVVAVVHQPSRSSIVMKKWQKVVTSGLDMVYAESYKGKSRKSAYAENEVALA